MDKLTILEVKVKSAVKLLQQLRDKNERLTTQYKKLQGENEFLLTENKQVTKLMAEVEKLKQEARTGATWRGHTLSKFTLGDFWKKTWFASCTQCPCMVTVEAHHGYEIVGDAVAIDCVKDTQRKG